MEHKQKRKRLYRKAVFIVTYFVEASGEIKYLILRRKKHWTGWEFPKGGVNLFESEKRAVGREVLEETGHTPIAIKKFKVAGEYLYSHKLKDRPKVSGQTYRLYAVQIGSKNIKYDKKEHSGYSWKTFKQAEKIISFENQKECLEIVDSWLKENLN